MHPLEDSPQRGQLFFKQVDRWILRVGKKIAKFLVEYRYLMSVFIIGFIVWAIVFNTAVIDYVNSNTWNTRAAWLGPFPNPGTVQIFGFTIEYQIEGYSDYSFYYVHWGYNSLYGVMPYSPDYGILELNGVTNENGAHMFPPFTSYLYAAGIALSNMMGWKNWGIGFLIAAFGFLTAVPIYGVASELSSNKHVGEVAALTYLLNPLMLYHTDFLWFNPAPFVFFFFAGFYMLIREKRLTGTLLIVCAALFKQTAWFLGIPLVVYLLVRPRERKKEDAEEPSLNEPEPVGNKTDSSLLDQVSSFLQPLVEYFDFRNFAISVIAVLIFVGAVMFPFLVAQSHFWDYWRLALGSFSFEGNFVDPPPYNVPMRVQVLPIIAGMPELAENLDFLIISGGPLGFGVIVCAGLMVLKDKFIGEERLYLRRILFMTMILLFIVTILGPRGVFKYYFVMLMPFLSIFSSARMIRVSGEHVPFSASMAWMPITLTLLILIPDRNIYLAFVILIFLGYLFAPVIDRLYHVMKLPFTLLGQKMQGLFNISKETLVVEECPIDITRKRSVANTITQISLLGLSLALLVFGWWTTHLAIGVDIVTGLEMILVFSAAFVVGFELLSIAISIAFYSEIRLTQLNTNLRNFTHVTVALLWIYGFRTYFLNWTIASTTDRQLLVFSSVFVSIWTVSLLLKQRNRIRFLTDSMLLGGLLIGLMVWHSLDNLTLLFFGGIGLCAVLVHMFLILIHSFDRGVSSHPDKTQPFQFVEGDMDHDQ